MKNFSYGSFCVGRSKGIDEGYASAAYTVRNNIRIRLNDAFKGMHDAKGLTDKQYENVKKIVDEIV